MLKHKFAKFIAKRVLICYILLSIIDIILINEKLMVFAGLSIGAIFGVLRLNSNAAFFANMVSAEVPETAAKKGAVRYAVAVLGVLAVMSASIAYDVWLFAGVTAGLLLIPLAVMINGLTESLGITHNNFE